MLPESLMRRGGEVTSQPLSQAFRTLARHISRFVGVEHVARALYNRVAAGRLTVTVSVSGSSYRFAAPTFTILDELASQSEARVMHEMISSLGPGETVWDVGAGYGMYTLPLSGAVGSRGAVIAFEPEPRTRKLLERNLMLNAMANVTIAGFALGQADAPGLLYRSRSATIGAHSLIRRTDYRVARRGIATAVRAADSLITLGELEPPSAVKIDTEGAEWFVLEGMARLLRNPCLRLLLVEVHPEVGKVLGRDPSEIEEILQRHGFRDLTTVGRGRQLHLLARRTSR